MYLQAEAYVKLVHDFLFQPSTTEKVFATTRAVEAELFENGQGKGKGKGGKASEGGQEKGGKNKGKGA